MQIKSFFTILLCFFGLITKAQLKNDTKSFVVVLDAGHGGKDPGAIGQLGSLEKNITLKASILLAKELRRNKKIIPQRTLNV